MLPGGGQRSRRVRRVHLAREHGIGALSVTRSVVTRRCATGGNDRAGDGDGDDADDGGGDDCV